MFDVLRIEQCQGALNETDASGAVREILECAVSKPAEVLAGLGEPARATVQKLHVADDLTIINVIWGPQMTIIERAVMKLMFAIIRARQTWRGVAVSEFERKQLASLREELDQKCEEKHVLQVRSVSRSRNYSTSGT
jgi:hypothetical protein